MNMDQLNMNGMTVPNGVGGGIPPMSNGANGALRPGGDQDHPLDYKQRLNTYIYDYLLQNEMYECARLFLNSPLQPKTRSNGSDHDTDSKDDIDTKRPHNLPLPDIPDPADANENSSFLLNWFSLFWDIFFAQRKGKGATPQALQYVHHSQVRPPETRERFEWRLTGMGDAADEDASSTGATESISATPGHGAIAEQHASCEHDAYPAGRWDAGQRQRDEAQNPFAKHPSKYVSSPGSAFSGGIRKANLGGRSRTPQQQMNFRNQQQQQMLQHQQQMERGGSDVDINGQRPRTPSSDNAPSPSKRSRLGGPPFNGQQMIPGGRASAQGMQGQQMMNTNAAQANHLLIQNDIDPSYLSPAQLEVFQQQHPSVQRKSIQVYAANMAHHHQPGVPGVARPGMPGQASSMMQPTMDVGGGMNEFYAANPAVMRGMATAPGGPNGAGGNALQDYQMQLMLLEQQNKKRLLMARQEADTMGNGDRPQMAGQGGFASAGMSPQGSRSGPSPNPSDQMKRGSPKMGPPGMGGSPMPDGSMQPARGSPAPMNFPVGSAMPQEMFKQMQMEGGMSNGAGPNVNGMRPPNSHPQFANNQMTQHTLDVRRAQAQQNAGRLPNGGVWPPGSQGQPMIPQAAQVQPPTQISTPQQRNAMPPPPGLPAGATTGGRPSSPSQTTQPPTPNPTNKANPSKKKDEKQRKVRLLPVDGP